jgi:uncharacterized membrane protein YgcG
MRRGVTLISVAMTAFSLVVVASVVYAYGVAAAPRPQTASVAAQPQAPSAAVEAASISAAPVVSAPVQVSPQDAAAAAAKFINRTDAYSVELADLSGVQCYKVTFSSGDVVYVGLDGQILSSVAPTAVPSSYAAIKRHPGRDGQSASNSGSSGGSGGGSGGESEGGGEHESEGGD